ncbi:hypothetical protein Pla100_55860 [Neorhodopirellula pilleata]|uniref:Uncharacterized protein n=1 Tax=Neorhodopirellula pilleata TaxID=2714738 RepID=A0A5C5ZP80_9BACT|nr:hypothetical protein Pla100_55860 [Neorhodopirellula pilleata]
MSPKPDSKHLRARVGGTYAEQPSNAPIPITLHPGCHVELRVPEMKGKSIGPT